MNGHQNRKPTSFAGRPDVGEQEVDTVQSLGDDATKTEDVTDRKDAKPQAVLKSDKTIKLGDSLASRARRRKKTQDDHS